MKTKIKQYVVINDSLKMSKGKIARVCLMCGTQMHNVSTMFQRIRWMLNNCNAVILKTSEFNELLQHLDTSNIKHFTHVDGGITQVARGSKCAVTFFSKDSDYTNKLKLY